MGCEEYRLNKNGTCELNGEECTKKKCPDGLWDGADNMAGYLEEKKQMIPGAEAAR